MRREGTLTARHVIACCDQLVHVLVHRDKLVLRERLLLFPIDERFRDLLLEPVLLECVDYLQLDENTDLR